MMEVFIPWKHLILWSAPSLVQTVISLFADEESTNDECDYPLPSHSLSPPPTLIFRGRRSTWRQGFRSLVGEFIGWLCFIYALVAWLFLFTLISVPLSVSLFTHFLLSLTLFTFLVAISISTFWFIPCPRRSNFSSNWTSYQALFYFVIKPSITLILKSSVAIEGHYIAYLTV